MATFLNNSFSIAYPIYPCHFSLLYEPMYGGYYILSMELEKQPSSEVRMVAYCNKSNYILEQEFDLLCVFD